MIEVEGLSNNQEMADRMNLLGHTKPDGTPVDKEFIANKKSYLKRSKEKLSNAFDLGVFEKLMGSTELTDAEKLEAAKAFATRQPLKKITVTVSVNSFQVSERDLLNPDEEHILLKLNKEEASYLHRYQDQFNNFINSGDIKCLNA